MRTRRARTPGWVTALLVVAVAGPAIWWLADRHDRVANQDRLAGIASDIAGRGVKVRCPGPLRRIGPDTVAGSVEVDADGAAADETRLSTATCAELDALAEGRRATELACAERSSSCGDDVQAVAWAVNALAHESFHLRGVTQEAVTECFAMQAVARAAQGLGATAAQAQGLAALHWETSPAKKGSTYQVPPGCADGQPLDLRPADPVWP